ncbi:NYN domain-containing protein [Hespellia stercorisuis]|uniref:OST-HTH/LOTUS domain-containing protein n=1 Tax=Hespellia stercorisuis DSM 15480 TaxID=1121950 RepID=A0A1M6P5M8_9FIRM|nr:NYN domain-containing protein [Hespellia stercorisuis]SHK03289.1 OST-HTH/LOTUS domain-containing protein [Hespellia stercorisuis DSM 15480]
MEDKKFAVLIDTDNISGKYVSAILDEMTKYGISTYKRGYGDWTSPHANKWRIALLENSITPMQQFSNTTGKNATDSALIIDAMDILYTKNVDGFCIVSSDGDFTRLASRLRESGMMVIGMGEEKTPPAFKKACSVFTVLENLVDSEEPVEEKLSAPDEVDSTEKKTSQNINKKAIESTIESIITENENNGRETGLGEIGSRLVNKYPDFDVRNYGYSLLSKFLEEMSAFDVRKQDSTIMVELKESKISRECIVDFIGKELKRKKDIGINELSNEVHEKYTDFRPKDFGYSQFSKFVQGIKGVEVYEDGNKRKRARYKA